MQNKYSEQIGFWLSDYGSILTHNKGLTKKDIEILKQAKEGDKLIMFENSKKPSEAHKPDYSLKVLFKREEQND